MASFVHAQTKIPDKAAIKKTEQKIKQLSSKSSIDTLIKKEVKKDSTAVENSANQSIQNTKKQVGEELKTLSTQKDGQTKVPGEAAIQNTEQKIKQISSQSSTDILIKKGLGEIKKDSAAIENAASQPVQNVKKEVGDEVKDIQKDQLKENVSKEELKKQLDKSATDIKSAPKQSVDKGKSEAKNWVDNSKDKISKDKEEVIGLKDGKKLEGNLTRLNFNSENSSASTGELKKMQGDAGKQFSDLGNFKKPSLDLKTMPSLDKSSIGDLSNLKPNFGKFGSLNEKNGIADLSKFQMPPMDMKGLSSIGSGKGFDGLSKMKAPAISSKAFDKISMDKIQSNKKLKGVQHLTDSLSSMKDKFSMDKNKLELLGAQKVYSNKFIKKLQDSLGKSKADSVFKVARSYTKKESSKDDLLKMVKQTTSGKASAENKDTNKSSLSLKDIDKKASPDQLTTASLSKLSPDDIFKFKMPQSSLSELTPLAGNQLDSKFLPVIDSMRKIELKEKAILMKEEKVTDEMKRTIVQKKPKFVDKIYFEGLVSFANDSTINIIKFTPALGYHFTDHFSVGLGPNILVSATKKKVNTAVGFRTFAKYEFWKKRTYLQLESNVDPSRTSQDVAHKSMHNLLGGGGVLIPITNSLAINVAALYKFNQDGSGQPFVFRIGFSSVKK